MKIGRKYIEDEYGVLYSEDGAVLLGYNRKVFHCAEYRIKDGVKILAANAFHNCQHLKSIFMPDSVIEDEGSIFEGCKNLEEARVSANLKNPDIAMFCGCSSLRYVELQEGLESIGENMFCGCTALKHIALPSTIMYLCGDTFCASGVEDIVLHEGLKEIGHDAFNGCYNLISLTIPSTVDFIGPWLVQGHREFNGVICKSSKFRIENEALISNEDDSFLACWTKKTEYHLPASVKNLKSVLNDQIETIYLDYPLAEIGFEAFIGCPSLKKINNSVNLSCSDPEHHLNEIAQMNPPEDQLGDGIDILVYGESTGQNCKKEPHFHFCKDRIGKGHAYAIDIEVKIRDIEKMTILRSITGNLTWNGLHKPYKKVLKWLNQKAYDAEMLNKEAIRQEWNRCNMSNRVNKEEL